MDKIREKQGRTYRLTMTHCWLMLQEQLGVVLVQMRQPFESRVPLRSSRSWWWWIRRPPTSMMGEEERRKERGGYREEGAKEERTRPGMASTLRTVSKDDDGVRESVGVGQRFPGQEIPSPVTPRDPPRHARPGPHHPAHGLAGQNPRGAAHRPSVGAQG